MLRRRQKLLAAAPGPAPWYWRTFPRFQSGTRSWSWRLEPSPGGTGGWPLLASDWDGVPRFVPGAYTYVTDAGDSHMLVWRADLSGAIEVRLHRVEELPAVAAPRTSWPTRDAVGLPALDEVRIPSLQAGRHEGFSLATPVAIGELLLLAHVPASGNHDAALAVSVWAPGDGSVTVLPQRWFTAENVDLGYQWVTRVARDSRTGRIVGDGIRLPAFELDDEGMTVRRWLRPRRV